MAEQRTSFLDLQADDVAALATAQDAPIAIPADYLGTVVANLQGLWRHAAVVKAALALASDAPAPTGPFEP
jgi:hypothetical protein